MTAPTSQSAETVVAHARRIALAAHAKQKDKNGDPYHWHLKAVADAVKLLGGDPEVIAAAWLHDIVEDTSWTFAKLAKEGFSLRTLKAVEAVTKKTNEDQVVFANRVSAGGRDALMVNVGDLLHHLRPDRLARLPEYTRNRLLQKYRPRLLRALLELELVVTEDTQAKLATKPVGTSWSSGSYSWPHDDGPDGTKRYESDDLIGGDWPLDWPAPIAEKVTKKGIKNGGSTYRLSAPPDEKGHAVTRTAFGRTWVYTATAWAEKRKANPNWLPKRNDLDWTTWNKTGKEAKK